MLNGIFQSLLWVVIVPKLETLGVNVSCAAQTFDPISKFYLYTIS